MEIPDQLQCLFTAEVDEQDDSYVFQIPSQEQGNLVAGETYRIAVLPTPSPQETDSTASGAPGADSEAHADRGHPEPPVEVGDRRDVEIESLGDQGDGIARVERGFVVIVSDTDKGERVTVEVTDVQETVAFADVVERISYYD